MVGGFGSSGEGVERGGSAARLMTASILAWFRRWGWFCSSCESVAAELGRGAGLAVGVARAESGSGADNMFCKYGEPCACCGGDGCWGCWDC